MGARRRLRLLSCTRVFRALESRTEVCFGGGEEEVGRKENRQWEAPSTDRVQPCSYTRCSQGCTGCCCAVL